MLMKQLTGGTVGGASEISFQYAPTKISGSYFPKLSFPTSAIKHFKSVIDPQSPYTHVTGYAVGYTNTEQVSTASVTLSDVRQLDSADFDVDKSYTYLVVICQVSSSASDRCYDITLTLE